MANPTTAIAMEALNEYNKDNFKGGHARGWTWSTAWSNVESGFETFINKYLFPKISETVLINVALGNRFEWLAKEIEQIGQFSEEYVFLDSIPVNLDLTKNAELMLKRNYPKMATALYAQGFSKKTKFTLNNNDVRLNFLTLADATKYALGVFQKRLSDINYSEETEIKGMIVDYALNHVKEQRTVASREELFEEVFESILNLQNNSAKYNEANTASGGAVGRYTTVTDLKNIAILTSDSMKTFLLDTKLANTFQVAGLDLSDRIISFDDLGGLWKLTGDVTINNEKTVEYFRAFNDYQIEVGDVIYKDTVFTFDVSELEEFAENVEELKPDSDLFAYVFDINKIRYKRNTKGALKEPFYNGEFDEVTYWIHYYSFKSMSPFFNSILIKGA